MDGSDIVSQNIPASNRLRYSLATCQRGQQDHQSASPQSHPNHEVSDSSHICIHREPLSAAVAGME
jgi:hypothetical protein